MAKKDEVKVKTAAEAKAEEKKTLDSALEVQQYLLAVIPTWRKSLAENRANSTGSLYVELTGRLEFLSFLTQEIKNLPLGK